MATFSLGGGVTPGAPGVYINEQAGLAANAAITSFSTVYMLVETDENVSTLRFPFNTPIPVTSLADYRVLLGGVIPTDRIPALSYNCVNEFFQNAQVGDLRVVRVGTPNQIVEIEFFPSGTKLNSTDLPSALMAGNTVYVQAVINGVRLAAGDGSASFDANGEYLGVPVVIPVNYVAGDEVNNRKISAAITAAVAAAIESNPAMRSTVYVRDFGLTNDLDPTLNSDTGYVTIAATTFDGNVSVVTEVEPVGSKFVFMQNTYDINNIVGQQGNVERVPQDYTQTIDTAFDGQQDQGYLITPTAYAQFDAAGRALVGAAAADHCASNSFKWMALADPGPFLVTDVNKYSDYVPHQAAADFVTGVKYLVDNAIFEWTGVDVTYDKLTYQAILGGSSAEVPVTESANVVAATTQVGLLDPATYTANSVIGQANDGKFSLDTTNYWPVALTVQEATLSGASSVSNDFYSLNGTTVYVVAPPFDIVNSGSYSNNVVFLSTSASAAVNIYNAVVLAGGSNYITVPPAGSFSVALPTGSTCSLTYSTPDWDLPVTINGQTSNLIENISGSAAGVNTLHLPGTLQSPTDTYRLDFITRTIFNPSNAVGGVSNYAGTVTKFSGAVNFNAPSHGLNNGQKLYFTQPITVTSGPSVSNLVSATTKLVSVPYYVTAVDANNFVLSNSLTSYTTSSYVNWVAGATVSTFPTIFYTQVLGSGLNVVTPTELLTLPVVRARKYAFDTSSIFNQAVATNVAVAPAASNPAASIYLNNSSLTLGEEQINPYGEDLSVSPFCGWLPSFNLVAPTLTPSAATENAYCVPTVDQFFQTEAFMVPAIDAIFGGVYDPAGLATTGPIATLGVPAGGVGNTLGTYTGVLATGGTGVNATFNVVIGNTATVGPIATLGAITAGAGTATVPSVPYSAPYAAVSLTGGTGAGATANVTVSNTAAVGPIATVGAFTPGSGTVNVAATTYTNSLVGAATTVTGTAGVGATLNVTINETAGVGPVFSVNNFITNAAGGISATYLGVPATGGSGSLVLLDITTDVLGNISGASVSAGGSGYVTGETLNVVGAAVGGGDFDIDVDFVTLPIAVTAATISGLGTGYDNTSVLSVLSASIDNIVGFSVPVATFTVPVGVTAVAPVGLGTGFTANDPLTAAPAAIGGVTGFSVLVSTVTLPTGVTGVTLNNAGTGYTAGNTLTISGSLIGGSIVSTTAVTFNVATITGATTGALSSASAYALATGLNNGSSGADLQSAQSRLVGVYFDVTNTGTAPDNTTAITAGDRIAVTSNGSSYTWAVVPSSTLGGDLTTVGQVLFGSQVQMVFTPEQTPPSNLWRFDAITSTELIDKALRGVGFNGVPQAVFIERGVDNVNALYNDSQLYSNPFGFIAYYGPWIENGAGLYVPPSPYVTGVAVRRYRSEGYQFPPAGVKYQLADAVAAQIPINSAQQNLLNPDGCNAIRTLPGYPQSAVFIWGGRTRLPNPDDAQQRLYQFVNTRVILNVVYGSLRSAFDSQIFNVIDGFGVIYNQIISVGNSILNQLYVKGALFGARPSDAFQVICDKRINSAADAENGIVNAKVFVTPVPTLERIQIDLIRVAIGQMQNELDIRGLGENNG